MADEADKASEFQAAELRATLSEFSKKIPRAEIQSWEQGPKYCEECGERIPDARRKAVPGVKFCVSCAQELYG